MRSTPVVMPVVDMKLVLRPAAVRVRDEDAMRVPAVAFCDLHQVLEFAGIGKVDRLHATGMESRHDHVTTKDAVISAPASTVQVATLCTRVVLAIRAHRRRRYHRCQTGDL